jgi:hypothetical protein
MERGVTMNLPRTAYSVKILNENSARKVMDYVVYVHIDVETQMWHGEIRGGDHFDQRQRAAFDLRGDLIVWIVEKLFIGNDQTGFRVVRVSDGQKAFHGQINYEWGSDPAKFSVEVEDSIGCKLRTIDRYSRLDAVHDAFYWIM